MIKHYKHMLFLSKTMNGLNEQLTSNGVSKHEISVYIFH